MPRSASSHRFAHCGLFRWLLSVAVLVGVTALPAFSQQQPPRRSANPAAAAATDAVAAPPVAEDAADPGGKQPPETEPAGDAPADEPPPAPDAPLPEGFVPPAAKPEYMTLRKPLMTQEEIQKEDGALRRIPPRGVELVLYAGELNQTNIDAIHRWAALRMAELTALDDWTRAGDITTNQILLPLRTAAAKQSNANRVHDFREEVCKALTEACKNVLDNNFVVRMQAVKILSELNIREMETTGTKRPPISYVPAMDVLLGVIADPQQPESVKILAAVGVTRIADYADIMPAELKFRAADVLTKELAKSDTHFWYQMRLAEAAAAIEFEIDRNGQPIVVDTLLSVIADGNRHCRARTAAARALGRTPIMAGKFDEKAAADRLAALARDMSLAYNKQPNDVQWYYCYLDLLLTFKLNSGEDVAGLPQNSLLRKGSLPAPINNVAQRIMPLAKHVMNQPVGKPHKPIPGEAIQRLSELLTVANQR